jgi:hypothetical protein
LLACAEGKSNSAPEEFSAATGRLVTDSEKISAAPAAPLSIEAATAGEASGVAGAKIEPSIGCSRDFAGLWPRAAEAAMR